MPTLTRGQKTKLADLTPSQQLSAEISASSSALKFDFSCFGVDENGQLSDDRYFVFYNQKNSPDGALAMSGNGQFAVDLSRLPATIKKLVFVATIDGNGEMRSLDKGAFRLLANGGEVARFDFTGSDFGAEKALMVAEIYSKDVWRLAAVGQGFAGGLNALLKHFGGEEIQPAAAPPTPMPVPAAPPPTPAPMPVAPLPSVNLTKVTLEKRGEKSKLDLRKGGGVQPIHVNLNWDAPAPKRGFLASLSAPAAPDLDLGCMFRLKDGTAGVIQPLGGNFGAQNQPPYIFLDKDDRSGAARDGENLTIFRPDLLDLVMVFAMVYEGASDFAEVGGRLTIKEPNGNEIFMRLNSPQRGRNFCAICTVRAGGSSVEITKEEQYFPSHREADAQFGFGFNWTAGRK